MSVKSRRLKHTEEDESYFISMTDMMVGLLFIFLILLVYFALQMRQKTEELTGANATRTEILKNLEQSLKAKGVRVSIDEKNGILRLPEDVLFASGDYKLSEKGAEAVKLVAHELAAIMPCYTYPRRVQNCPSSKHSIDALFVEGHTDTDQFTGDEIVADNLDLSTKRATNTFRQIVSSESSLLELRNSEENNAERVLSVSGYGEFRPIAIGDSPEAKAKNRRIDMRFLMVTPKTDSISVQDLKSGVK